MKTNNYDKNSYNNSDKKIGNLVTAFIIIVIFVFTATIIISEASKSNKANYETASVIINSGDTLTSIAKEYCEGQSVDTVISDIIKINNMNSTTIYAGQELLIPVYY